MLKNTNGARFHGSKLKLPNMWRPPPIHSTPLSTLAFCVVKKSLWLDFSIFIFLGNYFRKIWKIGIPKCFFAAQFWSKVELRGNRCTFFRQLLRLLNLKKKKKCNDYCWRPARSSFVPLSSSSFGLFSFFFLWSPFLFFLWPPFLFFLYPPFLLHPLSWRSYRWSCGVEDRLKNTWSSVHVLVGSKSVKWSTCPFRMVRLSCLGDQVWLIKARLSWVELVSELSWVELVSEFRVVGSRIWDRLIWIGIRLWD